jgi:steroid delta-isomerase-like uncharacterized protein
MTSLEIVQAYYTAFNAKNWPGILGLLDANIQHDVNQGETRIGLEKYEQFLQLMDESYEETLTDMVFMTDSSGERIAAEFVVNGIYKKGDEGFPAAHGQSYVLPAGAFLEVKNGKITRVTTYYNLPRWIELVSA